MFSLGYAESSEVNWDPEIRIVYYGELNRVLSNARVGWTEEAFFIGEDKIGVCESVRESICSTLLINRKRC